MAKNEELELTKEERELVLRRREEQEALGMRRSIEVEQRAHENSDQALADKFMSRENFVGAPAEERDAVWRCVRRTLKGMGY